jgi:hypothetical protein
MSEREQSPQELFADGAALITEVAAELKSEGYEHLEYQLQAGFYRLALAYGKRLEQLTEHYNTLEELHAHTTRYMPKTLYPGDVRVRGD